MRRRPSTMAIICALATYSAVSGCDSTPPAAPGRQATPTASASLLSAERLCPEADLDTRRILDCLNSDIASFWTRSGMSIGPQTFVYYALPETVPSAECARLLSLRSWFRCVSDDVVYLSGQLLERDRDLFGVDLGLAMAFIVAEEFGLALQGVLGQPGIDIPDPGVSRRVILTADCLAGVWAADGQDRDRLRLDELRSAIDEELTAGYQVPATPTVPDFRPDQVYGSVADRLAAFDRGSASGDPDVCG